MVGTELKAGVYDDIPRLQLIYIPSSFSSSPSFDFYLIKNKLFKKKKKLISAMLTQDIDIFQYSVIKSLD